MKSYLRIGAVVSAHRAARRVVHRAAGIAARLAACLAAFVVAGTVLLFAAYQYLALGLPDVQQLRDVSIQTPLSVYSRDGRLMEQFGEAMRAPVAYQDIPPLLVAALLAAEDEHFFAHPGVDYRGVTRAAINVLRTFGDRSIGGSTITQQVARMHFLSRDRRYERKFKEWILALRIEAEFTKVEILELYLNTYPFGHRSFGVVTAAQTYFGKRLDQLTIAEVALLAGIPQGPSILNPISNPPRAAVRRAYVLRRMRELDLITAEQYAEALEAPVESRRHGARTELDAPYLAEMVRAEMIRRFGADALTAGYKVTTTVDSRLQRAASDAVRQALIAYDERHGYRGPLAQVELPEPAQAGPGRAPEALAALLADYPDRAGTTAALVLDVGEADARIYLRARGELTIGFEAMAWAAPYINDQRVGARPRAVTDVLQPGDIVRFRVAGDGGLRLAQLPDVQGALVALDPLDGAVAALTGGFDFNLSNYNRAVQARRQPASAFKPFIYSAALEHGFTPASIVNDAPVSMGGAELGTVWRPTNDSGRFYGDMRLREALVGSMNVTAARVVRDIGLENAIPHLRAFGFDDSALPGDLAMSLGTGAVSPLDLARAYAVFANGGSLVEPYFIERVEDLRGNVVYRASPPLACADCDQAGTRLNESQRAGDPAELHPPERRAPRVIPAQNAYLMNDMLRDVIRRGTGQRALRLGRNDLAGKTGTSSDYVDAWFAGYSADIAATAWVGFDSQRRPLGRAGGAQEGGSRTALPMWSAFIAEALAGRPERPIERPPGIVELRINPTSGLVAGDSSTGTMVEMFYIDRIPEREIDSVIAEPIF